MKAAFLFGIDELPSQGSAMRIFALFDQFNDIPGFIGYLLLSLSIGSEISHGRVFAANSQIELCSPIPIL